MAISTASVTQSFHAQKQFQKRIGDDPTLITSCWYDGDPIDGPDIDTPYARVYEGPLCDDVVLLAVENGADGASGDLMIKTAKDPDELRFERTTQ